MPYPALAINHLHVPGFPRPSFSHSDIPARYILQAPGAAPMSKAACIFTSFPQPPSNPEIRNASSSLLTACEGVEAIGPVMHKESCILVWSKAVIHVRVGFFRPHMGDGAGQRLDLILGLAVQECSRYRRPTKPNFSRSWLSFCIPPQPPSTRV